MKNPAKSTQDELHHIAIGISVVFIILSVASVSLTILCDIYFNRNFGVNLVEVDVQNLSLIIQVMNQINTIKLFLVESCVTINHTMNKLENVF